MPELPEVETTRRGIAPALTGATFRQATIRQPRLRWAVPADLSSQIANQKVVCVARRGKYLLLVLEHGSVILHLGMSGSLRVVPDNEPPQPHDHVDLQFEASDGRCQILRLRDPRRFGAILWHTGPAHAHPLLSGLGPEPFDPAFDADYLRERLRGRRTAIKSALMDQGLVVGVGNIYASEALFHAGIRPSRAAGRLSRTDCQRLVTAVQQTLEAAMAAGGSTLRDFTQADGAPGYFQHAHQVYGRDGAPCQRCGTPIRHRRHGQRSTFWCPVCQPR
jgi:formamidopyrimidine-DNA glycosylase